MLCYMFHGMLSLKRFTGMIMTKLSIFRKDASRLTGTKVGGEVALQGHVQSEPGMKEAPTGVSGNCSKKWDVSALQRVVFTAKMDWDGTVPVRQLRSVLLWT